MKIIQYGAFDNIDDVAIVQLGKRWLKVPCWLACEWDNGGIYALIREYDLKHLTVMRPHEYQALDNIRIQARAIRRFYLYGDAGALTEELSRCLRVEYRVRADYPHLHGQIVYEQIATEMGTGYTWRQVKAMLDDASDALVIQEATIEENYFRLLAKRIAKMNIQDNEIAA